jgi:drug/metabolite transporter (DMT)-like permease
MIDPQKRHLGIIYASITALFWGFLAIALKVAVNLISPYAIVWFRFLVAFSILFLYFLFTDKQKLRILLKPPLVLIVTGIFLGLNYIGFMQGINYTSPGTAQIIVQLGPILMAIVGVVIYKETLVKRQIIGFLIAGLGLLLFYNDQLENLIKNKETFNIGIIFILFAAISWVVYASFQKKMVQSIPPQQINLFIYAIPIIMFIPFVHPNDFQILEDWQWFLLLFLGINTLIAYGALAASFKYLEANKVSIIITLNPIVTFIIMSILAEMSITWIQPETISLLGFGGAFLVLCGAILAVKPAYKKKEINSHSKDIFNKI